MSLFKGFMGVIASPKVHFSQFGEDIFIQNYFRNKRAGFFVDVGCFHPYYASNTARLYWKGWKGINVDMDAKKLKMFKFFRPRDKNVLAAVSDRPGKSVKINRPSQTSYGSMDSISECTAVEAQLETTTLTHILAAQNSPEIDFLSVDVEGHDLLVLKGLDFEKYQPDLICVELHQRTLTEVLNSDLNEFLSERRYQVIAWNPPSVFYSQKIYVP